MLVSISNYPASRVASIIEGGSVRMVISNITIRSKMK